MELMYQMPDESPSVVGKLWAEQEEKDTSRVKAQAVNILLNQAHAESNIEMVTGTYDFLSALDIKGLIDELASTESLTEPVEAESVRSLFQNAREEFFEDGMESDFSRELLGLIVQHSSLALDEIADVILKTKANEEIISEALRWLGYINHPQTHTYRFWILIQSLFNRAARIRDGALLGISYLDDPDALFDLNKAIHREEVEELQEDMKRVYIQLEKTQNASSIETHP